MCAAKIGTHERAPVLSPRQLTRHLQQIYAPKKATDADNGNKMDGRTG